jgi:hypothetical protein
MRSAYQWRFTVRTLRDLGHEAFLGNPAPGNRFGLPLRFPRGRALMRGGFAYPAAHPQGRTMSIRHAPYT